MAIARAEHMLQAGVVRILLGVTLLAIVSNTARAARWTDSIQLRYSAPAGCPTREAVLHAIDILLEDAPLDRTLRVAAEVSATANGGYALSLTWEDNQGAGRREIEAESCHAAADAAAWLIAQALKRPEQADPTPLRYEFALHAETAFGVLPGVAWGATLRLGISWAALHADLSVSYFPAKNAERDGANIELDLAELALSGCYLASSPHLGFGPCLRAALGRMSATSSTLHTPSTGAERLQAFGLALQLRARLAELLWLFSNAGLDWNQRRPIFVVSGSGTVHQPSTFGLRLGLGVALILE
jgi:hypothetical protein